MFEKASKDVLILIALNLNFSSIYNFSRCNRNLYRIIWNNASFWKNKISKDFNYNFGNLSIILQKKYCKIYYEYCLYGSMQKGFNLASAKGYKPLVQYYLIHYPKLDVNEALRHAWDNHRKNTYKLLRKRADKLSLYSHAINLF